MVSEKYCSMRAVYCARLRNRLEFSVSNPAYVALHILDKQCRGRLQEAIENIIILQSVQV